MKYAIIITSIIFGIYALYQFIKYIPRILCWFKAFKKQEQIINNEITHIAVVIPARNESQVVPSLFDSLKKQDYPQDKISVFVVVKDKEDPTIKICDEYGYKVIVCETQTCKSDALDEAYKYIIRNYDNVFSGVVTIDADSVLSDNFITEMNNSLASGREIMQGKRVVKNYLDEYRDTLTLQGVCNGMIWTYMDEMGNKKRNELNVAQMIVGSGFMIRYDILKKMGGWPYKATIADDIELQINATLSGYSIYYNERAIVYMEEAPTLEMTNKRRTRWLKGVIDTYRIYKDKLKALDTEKGKKDFYYATENLNICYKLIGSIFIYALINLIYSLSFFYFNQNYGFLTLWLSIGGFTLIYLMFMIQTIFGMIVDRKYIKLNFFQKIALIFVNPLFYYAYIYIIGKGLLTPTSVKWDAIERCENNGTK